MTDGLKPEVIGRHVQLGWIASPCGSLYSPDEYKIVPKYTRNVHEDREKELLAQNAKYLELFDALGKDYDQAIAAIKELRGALELYANVQLSPYDAEHALKTHAETIARVGGEG